MKIYMRHQRYISIHLFSCLFLREMQKGSQHICVESPGVHNLHFVNPCVFFGSPVLKMDTSNPSVQYLHNFSLVLCDFDIMNAFFPSIFVASNFPFLVTSFILFL